MSISEFSSEVIGDKKRWRQRDVDPNQYSEADRREVDPPMQVETATWTPGGQLDWWVKERRPRLEWFGRVRGKDGRQRWIKASDIRPASSSQP